LFLLLAIAELTLPAIHRSRMVERLGLGGLDGPR
jgi:hypothetical protein